MRRVKTNILLEHNPTSNGIRSFAYRRHQTNVIFHVPKKGWCHFFLESFAKKPNQLKILPGKKTPKSWLSGTVTIEFVPIFRVWMLKSIRMSFFVIDRRDLYVYMLLSSPPPQQRWCAYSIFCQCCGCCDISSFSKLPLAYRSNKNWRLIFHGFDSMPSLNIIFACLHVSQSPESAFRSLSLCLAILSKKGYVYCFCSMRWMMNIFMM